MALIALDGQSFDFWYFLKKGVYLWKTEVGTRWEQCDLRINALALHFPRHHRSFKACPRHLGWGFILFGSLLVKTEFEGPDSRFFVESNASQERGLLVPLANRGQIWSPFADTVWTCNWVLYWLPYPTTQSACIILSPISRGWVSWEPE